MGPESGFSGFRHLGSWLLLRDEHPQLVTLPMRHLRETSPFALSCIQQHCKRQQIGCTGRECNFYDVLRLPLLPPSFFLLVRQLLCQRLHSFINIKVSAVS